MSANLITLYLQQNEGVCVLPHEIPVQTLRLKSYAFDWFGTPEAQDIENRTVMLEVDWISQQQCMFARTKGQRETNGYLPLISPTSNGRVTSCDIAVTLAKPITRQFKYRLLKINGETKYLDTTLQQTWVTFEYNTI